MLKFVLEGFNADIYSDFEIASDLSTNTHLHTVSEMSLMEAIKTLQKDTK